MFDTQELATGSESILQLEDRLLHGVSREPVEDAAIVTTRRVLRWVDDDLMLPVLYVGQRANIPGRQEVSLVLQQMAEVFAVLRDRIVEIEHVHGPKAGTSGIPHQCVETSWVAWSLGFDFGVHMRIPFGEPQPRGA